MKKYKTHTEDGHYYEINTSCRKNSKHHRCVNYKVHKPRVKKKFFYYKDLYRMLDLTKANDWETQLLGWQMINQSKTARHYALSYKKVSQFVLNQIFHLKFRHVPYTGDKGYAFYEWVEEHTIYFCPRN